ncbi:MAG: MBL fold metallo-hydrolase [Nanoarchaeota archaeon]|nr:MBL fold metallo-hydrolase [Nanoarchaeota archaeon]
MQIRLYGAAKVVTGSCYSVTVGKDKILVDCGMFQGSKELEKLNYDNPGFDPKTYKAIVLTHAHLDHCGRIPKIVKYGFKGPIYATSATKELAQVVMLDAANIAAHDTMYENKRRRQQGLAPREPIYTENDVKNALKMFKKVDYNQVIKVTEKITAIYHDAGHILGAGSVELRIDDGEKKTIVFSGDLGQIDTPIVRDPEIIQTADYLFLESTYGDRLHPPIQERKNKFLKIIRETYKKGGKLLIPSFAIERAQELLYNINEFVEKGLMPKMQVFLDSPMAIRATVIFKRHPEFYDVEIKELLDSGDNPFVFPGLSYSMSVEESKSIRDIKEPCIVIAGSGMATAGRIKHHIKNHISDPKNTILFVGYQAYGTLGYWIKKGEKRVRLLGEVVNVKAKVESIDSFSAHADYQGLLDWLKFFNPKPKKVFLTHGEPKSALSLSKKIQKMGIQTHIPEMKESILL